MAEENKLRNIGSEERNAISKKTTKAKRKKKNKGTVIFKGIVIGLIFLMLFAEGAGLYYLAHHTKKIKRANETLQQKVTNLETYIKDNIDKESIAAEKRRMLDVVSTMNSVSHRGYNYIAPENTLPAFILSKEKGFNAVESDVCFTKDNVPVMIHDYEISRTSNGSGDVRTMTFEELRQYDFGSWKSEEYAGTQIPSFDEYIGVCKKLGLRPYIHLKHETDEDRTEEKLQILVDVVKKYDMEEHVTWLDYHHPILNSMADKLPESRYGFVFESGYELHITGAQAFKEAHPNTEFFFAACIEQASDKNIEMVMEQRIPLEIWCVNDEEQMINMHPYVSGVISDNLSFSEVLYNDIVNK